MKLKHLHIATMLAAAVTLANAQTYETIAPHHSYLNSGLPWHAANLDAEGRLLPWYEPDKNLGFDRVMHLAWNFMEHQVKTDPKTGQKAYLINSRYDPKTGLGNYWQHNPASTFGQFVDSLVTWYPYAQDDEAIGVVRSMLDYQLTHGTTPSDWNWANVPFATSCGDDPQYGKCLKDAAPDFYGGIETDKVGELGIGYVLFYEMTGDKKYLAAGIQCADALAKHIRSGDETHTPWPFRVNAKTGEIIGDSEYGGMIVAPVRLFAELVRIGEGDTARYESSQKAAWAWIMQYPMHNNKWVNYFEDAPSGPSNANQASPTMTAYYILMQPDPASVDPHWVNDVGSLLDWVKKHYGRGPYFGAWAIDEQGSPPEYTGCCSRTGLASDTSRWGAMNALYYEATNDGQAYRNAFASLSYSTYFAADDGEISCCGVDFNEYWFDDGYGDYVRNFMWALGAIPELSPTHQNHLLRSTSVVQHVRYEEHGIEYRTFDRDATEVLRLTYKPSSIKVGDTEITARPKLTGQGYTVSPLGAGDYVIRVRHSDSGHIKIAG